MMRYLGEAWKPVTVEQFLAQTSGICSCTDDPGWWGRQGEDLTPAQRLDTYAKLDVKIEFVRNADGTVKEAVILRDERRIPARRLP